MELRLEVDKKVMRVTVLSKVAMARTCTETERCTLQTEYNPVGNSADKMYSV